jgi:DNA-binding transcriptional LysR family regulator
MDTFGVEHIRVFLEVVERGSFSAAARSMDRAQATISYTIGNLERALDVELFDRSGHKPRLTEAGRSLLVHARAMHEEASRLQAVAASFADGHEPRLGLAVDLAASMVEVASAAKRCRSRFPGVRLELIVQDGDEVIQAVLSGRASLGLCGQVGTVAGLVAIPLEGVSLVAVVASGHRLLSSRVPLSVDELGRHCQLVAGDSSDAWVGFDAVGGDHWQCADLGARRRLLLEGVGWAVVPRHLVEADLSSERLVTIHPPGWPEEGRRLQRHLVFARRRPPGPAGTWLLEALREGLGREVGQSLVETVA